MKPILKKIKRFLSFRTVIWLPLLVVSIGMVVAVFPDLKSALLGDENRGALFDQRFLLNIVLSITGVCGAMCAYISWKSRQMKGDRKQMISLILKFLMTFLVENILFSAVVIGVISLTNLKVGLYIFDLLLLDVSVFLLVMINGFDRVFSALKAK